MKHLLKMLGVVLVLTACGPVSLTQNPAPLAPSQQQEVNKPAPEYWEH